MVTADSGNSGPGAWKIARELKLSGLGIHGACLIDTARQSSASSSTSQAQTNRWVLPPDSFVAAVGEQPHAAQRAAPSAVRRIEREVEDADSVSGVVIESCVD
jgi:hypothetical protein